MTFPPPFNPLPSEMSEQHKAHGALWYKWLHHLIDKPAKAVELGAWKGESAEWMLDHIFTHPESRYLCVDTFEGSEEHKVGGVDCSGHEEECRKRLARFGGRAVVSKSTTVLFLGNTFHPDNLLYDFGYVDAAHDAMNVLRDSVLLFDLLKVGGVMVWDDFLWEVFEQPIDRPKMAIESFLGCYARRLEVIGYGSQVAVKKLA